MRERINENRTENQDETSPAAAKREKKPLTVFGTPFVYLYLLGILTAFWGWLVENTAKLITSGVMDSRFHFLPFISSYALIPFAFCILLGDPDDLTCFGRKIFKTATRRTKVASNLISLLLITLVVFVSELAVGNCWEALFDVRLWDYSDQKFHVTQYAGLSSALGFGVGAWLIFKFVYKPAISFLQRKVPHKVAVVICSVIGALTVVDSAVMATHIVAFRKAPVYWVIRLR